MKNIVIIGGGFGGVYAAKNLIKLFKHADGVHITLVNNTNYFLFIPMLHEIATGTLSASSLAEPLREILRGKHFSFVRERAMSVDLHKQKVKTETMTLSYDYLIIATGSMTNYFNTPGADHCLTLKNEADAINLKNHLITSIERSFYSKTDKEKQMFATAAVIGAGPTGVELSLEIKEFIDQILKSNANNHIDPHVYLIQSGDAILPHAPKLQGEAMRALKNHGIHLLLNSRVANVMKRSVIIDNGQAINAATIVWTAGVKPNPIETAPHAADERGFFHVNEFLQLKNYPNVYAVGDCAHSVPRGHGRQLPMLAQVASKQGTIAAINIAQQHFGKPLKVFDYTVRGMLLSLGKRKGAGVLFGISIRGFFAWWLMRTIYLFKIIGVSNKLKTAYDWTLDLFVKRDTTEV